jgi:tRNA (guanine37-N1)-methyltransferase
MTPFIPKTKLIPVKQCIRFHIITLFPESFSSYISESIIARAQEEGRMHIRFYNPRQFVTPTKTQEVKELPYLRVDNNPYGGGPGMVIEALPMIHAIEHAQRNIDTYHQEKNTTPRTKILFMSPGGVQFTNELAREWVQGAATTAQEHTYTDEHASEHAHESAAQQGGVNTAGYTDIIIICGRYEGVDERVNEIFNSEHVSIGPFVLTGGELPAMVLMDAMARQIEGVLGNFDSREEARAASHAVYTRPEVIVYNGKEYRVPEVLLSGDHKKIEEWRAGER